MSKSITVNTFLLDPPVYWKDAEVCEVDSCVLHDNKAQYDGNKSVETADRSDCIYCLEVCSHSVLKKTPAGRAVKSTSCGEK